ncbi:MAG: DNA primase [Gammaproteobacteria bacterium AqS3]|nr:DNA primase [Gammaproteobacteria bacterium AqS3]
MARIQPKFIEQLREHVDIVDFLSTRLEQFRRNGREYVALCPFHPDRKPSLTISPQKNFYHCFVCKASGDALKFLTEHDRLGFVDAVEQLAAFAGIPVEYEDGGPAPQARRGPDPHKMLENIADYYRSQLKQAPEVQKYLAGRGISDTAAERFLLGYAPARSDYVAKLFGTDEERIELLKTLGMLRTAENPDGSPGDRTYAHFRNRLMFPIRDARGRVVGFGGRALDENARAKYLNSIESFAFHKGELLYGRYESRTSRSGHRLVVEGYTDVIALHAAGIDSAVATLGTSATEAHFQSLFRLDREVVLCFDGDAAGRLAASRALETALPQLRDGRLLKVMFLPQGEDPDSVVSSRGADHFRTLQDGAMDLERFLLECVGEEFNLERADGIAAFAERVTRLLARLPADGVLAQTLCAALAEQLRQDRELWLNKLTLSRQNLPKRERANRPSQQRAASVPGQSGRPPSRSPVQSARAPAHAPGRQPQQPWPPAPPEDFDYDYAAPPDDFIPPDYGPPPGHPALDHIAPHHTAPPAPRLRHELCVIATLLAKKPQCIADIPTEQLEDIRPIDNAQVIYDFAGALIAADGSWNKKAWNEWIDKPELQPYLKEKLSLPSDDEDAEREMLMHYLELLGRSAGTRASRLLVKWAQNPEHIEELGHGIRRECNQRDIEDVQVLLKQKLARSDQKYELGPQTFERTDLEELAQRMKNFPPSSRQQAN